ncbi:MAG: sortase [Bacillota bacterium]|nr:sortase [Bacillota bacterium]
MNHRGRTLIILGLLLIAAAIGLVVFNLWDDRRAAETSEAVLEELLPDIIDKDAPEGIYPDEMPSIEIDGQKYIGVISIPAIGIDLPVNGEWSYPALKNSPCRYFGSAYTDDLVLCAHNYNWHFGKLKTLSYGDTVLFTDVSGNVFTYEVSEIEVLRPTSVEEMLDAQEWDLTLFTCTIGGATRVTVRCTRLSNNLN